MLPYWRASPIAELIGTLRLKLSPSHSLLARAAIGSGPAVILAWIKFVIAVLMDRDFGYDSKHAAPDSVAGPRVRIHFLPAESPLRTRFGRR
jgi:hypothetical protein